MSILADVSSLFEICLQPSKVEDLEFLYQNSSSWNKNTDIEAFFQAANIIAMNPETLAARAEKKKQSKSARETAKQKAQVHKELKKQQSLLFSPVSWTQPSPWPMPDYHERYCLAAPTLPYLICQRLREFVSNLKEVISSLETFLRKAFLDKDGYDAVIHPLS
jgi:hypothetical protein